MPSTTRELNVTIIFLVTLVAVLLLAAIIFISRAGYNYFHSRQIAVQYERAATHTYDSYNVRMDNPDLAKLVVEQEHKLQVSGPHELVLKEADPKDPESKPETLTVQGMPIQDAMQTVAEHN